ncbi:hypothetical protein CTI12_AA506740 [Artemisia annua]|uniref:Uncharacterized protein n=1 Tax=Artemisia annua TaxID=35608 RepID=A0A2U1LCA4_ARTAN|nr:hypothetical protein CTI12_AA506740 [Artemisia annua]
MNQSTFCKDGGTISWIGHTVKQRYFRGIQTYINARTTLYEFRDTLNAANVFLSNSLAAQLAQVDTLKRTTVSELLD